MKTNTKILIIGIGIIILSLVIVLNKKYLITEYYNISENVRGINEIPGRNEMITMLSIVLSTIGTGMVLMSIYRLKPD